MLYVQIMYRRDNFHTADLRQVKDYLDNLKTCLWWQNQVSQNMIFFLPGHLPETVARWKTAAQDHSWRKKRYFSNRVCGNKTGHIFEHIGIICRPVSGNKTQRFWQDVKAISRHNQGKPSQLPRHLPETVDRWKTTVQDRSCQKPGMQFAAMIVASIPVIFLWEVRITCSRVGANTTGYFDKMSALFEALLVITKNGYFWRDTEAIGSHLSSNKTRYDKTPGQFLGTFIETRLNKPIPDLFLTLTKWLWCLKNSTELSQHNVGP